MTICTYDYKRKIVAKIFSTNKFDEKEIKSSITCKSMFNLENRLKTIK